MASENADRVRVGVVLAQPGDLAEWLADAAAFDAAGADVLWLDLDAESGVDPSALAAALAAVTVRSRIVAALPHADSVALATIARLSRGRLGLVGGAEVGGAEVGGVDVGGAEVGEVRARAGMGVFRAVVEEPGAFDDVSDAEADGARRWVTTQFPADRTAWRTTLTESAQRGVHGVLITADPRLLDLLRNPDDLGDRRDLQLSVG